MKSVLVRFTGWACAASVVLAAGGATAGASGGAGDEHGSAKLTRPDRSDDALRLLREGNQRFIDGKPMHPNTDVFRIADTGEHGQHPFAAILTCADSRLGVERLFDRGMGDLFVVRVAGNVGDANQAGSIEYACEHLGTQVVVVLGHTRCGAVKAAVDGVQAGKNIGSLLDNIAPAVTATRTAHPHLSGSELVDAAVKQNVWQSVEDLMKGSAMLRGMVERGQVKVVGAVYDVTTGRVEWMGAHPTMAAVLRSCAEMEATAQTMSDMPAAGAASEPKNAEKPAATRPTPAARPAASKPVTPRHDETPERKPAHASHPH